MIINNPKKTWKNRILIGTPTTGLIRIEWAERRYSQVVPTNWTVSDHKEFMSSSMPLRFQVSDAQNIIVERVIREDFEWMWLIEQDNVLPFDAFIRINQYMLKKKYPVVSGLYFTKGVPPEPIVYRGRGNSYFQDWKMGDKFFADGVPTGCTLIHSSLLKVLWDDSPEYIVGGRIVRRVFEEPARIVFNPVLHNFTGEFGTSDLEFCTRVIKGKYLIKAGWEKIGKQKYPFLVDTNLFTYHIDNNGRMWPLEIPKEFLPDPKKKKKDEYFGVGRGPHGENG